MSRRCQITGKGRLKGNTVSHANNRAPRSTYANIVTKKIFDTKTGSWLKLKISTRALRTINKKGLYETLKSM